MDFVSSYVYTTNNKSIINWWGLITCFIYSLLITYQKKKYSLLKNGVCPTRDQGE